MSRNLFTLTVLISIFLGLILFPSGRILAQPPTVVEVVSASGAGASLEPLAWAGSNLEGAAVIVSGNVHTCVLTSTGGAKCWGGNSRGQLGDGLLVSSSTPVDVVGLSSGARMIAAGGHTCAVTRNGGAKCWGGNDGGQLGNGATMDSQIPVDVIGLSSGVAAIAVGGSHSCALTDQGGVWCWGDNSQGQLGDGTTIGKNTPVAVPDLTSGVKAIIAGGNHSCAVTIPGGIKCWGANAYGQLGDGTTVSKSTSPVNVVGLGSGVAALAAGDYHTCALTGSGGVKCWGMGLMGQLGDGGTAWAVRTPVDVVGLASGVAAITAGSVHTCAMTTSQGAKCWGSNNSGRLGDGTTNDQTTPVNVTGLVSGVAGIAAGGYHTCAIMGGGGAKCWGHAGNGQLGDGATVHSTIPRRVAGLPVSLAAVSTGGSHACALSEQGGVFCWGSNPDGELGNGTKEGSGLPVAVTGLDSGVQIIAAGGSHNCALAGNGQVKCWGFNGSGQLGDGTKEDRTTPVDVVGLPVAATSVTCGGPHSCALLLNGQVQCWGEGGWGQLGDQNHTDSSTPVLVQDLIGGATIISNGSFHSCALVTTNQSIYCWGYNKDGQLGSSAYVNSLAVAGPVAAVELGTWARAVFAGSNHTCAITTNGTAKCWGGNEFGQLGDGTKTGRYTPMNVTGLTSNVTDMDGAIAHTCAVVSGAAKCWGWNGYGEVGDGTTTDRLTPANVFGLADGVSKVATGSTFTCAVAYGRVYCWGDNSSGQLGLGDPIFRTTPFDVLGSASARLVINYTSGKPGSVFTIIGSGFPPGSTATISANGEILTAIPVSASGDFTLVLDSTGADPGNYYVTASVNPSATVFLVLDQRAPQRLPEGSGPVVILPPGIALHVIYLPLVLR